MFAHPPVAVGLTVCRDVTVERPTQSLTLVRLFSHLAADSFPYDPGPFYAFAVLTDGYGEGQLELVVTKLDDPMLNASRSKLLLRFPDPLRRVECIIRVPNCTFPSPGVYLFGLYADGEWLAQTPVHVRPGG
jgi:hypothetical protein